MANRKISDLTSAGALTGAEELEIIRPGTNLKTTTQDIADLGGGGSGTVESVTGDGVDNTDPDNPVISYPVADEVGFTPAGNIVATEVQAAIVELDTEKAPLSSPTFTGTPAAPTAAPATSTTQLATTEFVMTNAVSSVGIQDLFIPSSSMWPRVTNGCGALAQFEMATSLFNVQALPFDQTTQEFAQFQIVLPRKWNNGTITVVPYWTATSGSGTVQWGISGGAFSNDDALTVTLGTAQTSDDTLIATNDLHIGPATSAITLAGTPADADFLAIQVSRNPASDTLNADALLLGISVRLTTNSGTDA